MEEPERRSKAGPLVIAVSGVCLLTGWGPSVLWYLGTIGLGTAAGLRVRKYWDERDEQRGVSVD